MTNCRVHCSGTAVVVGSRIHSSIIESAGGAVVVVLVDVACVVLVVATGDGCEVVTSVLEVAGATTGEAQDATRMDVNAIMTNPDLVLFCDVMPIGCCLIVCEIAA
jgi:hypothetical protein